MSTYTYSACQLFLHSCSSRMNPTTWRTLVDLGIAARLPTRRGCRGGSRKQRAITRVVGCRPPTDRTCTRPCYVNLVQVPISRLPETVSKTKFALINARSPQNKALLVRDYVDVDILYSSKVCCAAIIPC